MVLVWRPPQNSGYILVIYSYNVHNPIDGVVCDALTG